MRKIIFVLILIGVVLNPLVVNASRTSLLDRVKGHILLQVESKGEAWYIHPETGKRYYLKDGNTAYQIMRQLGLGITDTDIYNIRVGTSSQEDRSDCKTGTLAHRVKGKILLQVEAAGRAWYVRPDTCSRVYLRDGASAFDVMRKLGLGITTSDLQKIQIDTVTTTISSGPNTEQSTPSTTNQSKSDAVVVQNVPIECIDGDKALVWIGEVSSTSYTKYYNHCEDYIDQSLKDSLLNSINAMKKKELEIEANKKQESKSAYKNKIQTERLTLYNNCIAAIEKSQNDLGWLSPNQQGSVRDSGYDTCKVYLYLDPSAQCEDGTYSYSQTKSGTCSWHGGVQKWLKNLK